MKKAIGLLSNFPVFDQNSVFKIVWDIIIVILTMVEIFVYSIERSFNVDLFKSDRIKALFLTVIMIFHIDILVTLNTNIYSAGVQVKTRGTIFVNYVKKLFIFDLAASIGVILYFTSTRQEFYSDVNILLLFKIFCKQGLHQKFQQLIARNDKLEAVFDLLSLGLTILISGHIIACLWYFISFDHYEKFPMENTWLQERSLINADWKVKYLNAIYWSVTTMLTVGYGDITPKNESEMFFNIWAMFFGCVLFGYSLNSIGEILKKSGKYARLLK